MNRVQLVLELLYDRGEGFSSIDELCAASNLTRAGLDSALEALRQRGHGLEYSPAYGIRLIHPVTPDAWLIERGLGTRRIGRSVICFDEVGSTNDVAFDSARQASADGLVILSRSQRSGRGRQGRRWVSPPGAGVLMSVLLVEPQEGLAQEAVTIAAGLAVAQAIDDACGMACALKWPNDVLLEGRKVSGVLVEVRRQKRRRCIVIGIGVNVNAAPGSDQVDRLATCLADHHGHPLELTPLVRCLLLRLDHWVEALAHGAVEDLHAEWLARCGMVNQRCTAVSAGKRYVGRVLDVSPLDGLILNCDDGRTVHLPADSTTVL